MNIPRVVTGGEDAPTTFTVATLVTKPAQYAEMVNSFQAHGFGDESSEFLYVDNSLGNRLDAYDGLRALISRALGKYVILVHQDVLLLEDGRDVLEARLGELERKDPRWAVAGNAGAGPGGKYFIRISDPHSENYSSGPFPARVLSLDENFVVLKRAAMISPSIGPSGFHLYATDLCLQARLKGMSAYVIDFHLRHLSGGRIDQTFRDSRRGLERAYHHRLRGGLIHTTSDLLVITPSRTVLFFGQLMRRLLRSFRRA